MDVKPLVEDMHAHWVPPGKALPLGALYVHVLTAEDFFIQGLLKGGVPLWDSSWKGSMGLSEPRPPRGQPWEDWARRVRIDMAKLREYAKAVFAATDAYVDSLSEGDLEKEIQFNERKIRLVGFFLGVMCTHCANHTGEISTLKGLQGLKGYPF
jgi:hypothetical protein